jgi:NhaA family Na+:H+ antiporter
MERGRRRLLRGWAIPCATDIAFSYLVAKLIFRRHAAVPFVLLLAIADDAFGLAILAAFYPDRRSASA